MNLTEIAFTLNASGAGTVDSAYVSGHVCMVRVPNAGTAWGPGGTCDLTITRVVDGGTILSAQNFTAPFEYNLRPGVTSTTGGTSAYSTGVGPVYDGGVPVAGAMRCVIAQGSALAAGTIYAYVAD